MSKKSSLLIDESPLQVLRSLAYLIGLNEAIVLQQIHWWIKNIENDKRENRRNDHFFDGNYWTRGHYSYWQEKNFPFWSTATIKRIFVSLLNKNILIRRYEDGRENIWYRINYDQLNKLDNENPKREYLLEWKKRKGQSDLIEDEKRKGQNDLIEKVKVTSPKRSECTNRYNVQVNDKSEENGENIAPKNSSKNSSEIYNTLSDENNKQKNGINPQEASIPQASTNIQEDPKTAENILDLQKAEEIVKNHFNTNGKYEKEIHKKLKPMVVKDSITENELLQQLEAAGTIWKWFGKNEPRPQPVQSYQKEYPKNGRAKVESNVETGLERWTRDFMIGKLIPLDTELNDDRQRLFYNRKSHPKIFQPAYDGSWPQEEILRRYEIYMSRGGYYAKAGHPLALFVSQFDQFAKRKKRQRVDKSKLLFGGRTETDGSGDFVYEMPPEQRAKMHAEDKALAEKYRKERIERNGGEDYEDDFGLKLSKLDE